MGRMVSYIKNLFKKKEVTNKIVIEYIFRGYHTNIDLCQASMNDRLIFAILELNGKCGYEILKNSGIYLKGNAWVFFENYFKEND